jgi:molybdopterin converting factor small subunit
VANVTLTLPGVLRDAVGKGRLKIRARTLREALDQACLQEPALRFHLFNDDGQFREHVLCFVNGNNTRDMKSLNVPLSEGDEISILQAVSGG